MSGHCAAAGAYRDDPYWMFLLTYSDPKITTVQMIA